MECPKLRGQPANWTAAEQELAIGYMATWPLSKLRKHQSLNAQQTVIAYRDKKNRALANLQAMCKLYAAAVDRREFPEEALKEIVA